MKIQRTNPKSAYTLIDLLAVIFIVTITGFAWNRTRNEHSRGLAFACLAGGGAAVGLVALAYKAIWRGVEQQRERRRSRYPSIYRLLEISLGQRLIKLAPVANDRTRRLWLGDRRVGEWWINLSARADRHLERGLFAAFRPEQFEKVGPKLVSQYDWNWTWINQLPPSHWAIKRK